jgi:hypothetical protein
MDFQIWTGAGKRRLPRKMPIIYLNLPSSPKYTAVFTDWIFPRTSRGASSTAIIVLLGFKRDEAINGSRINRLTYSN